MKKLLLFSLALLITLTAFISPEVSYKKAYSPQTAPPDPFILGAMNNQTDWDHLYNYP